MSVSHPPSRPETSLSPTKKAVFALVVVCAVGLLAELTSRTFSGLVGPTAEKNYNIMDPELGWVPIPGFEFHITSLAKAFDIKVRIDDRGFRRDTQQIANASVADVVLVGDSHVFGYGLTEEETLSSQLHERLSADGEFAVERSNRPSADNATLPLDAAATEERSMS